LRSSAARAALDLKSAKNPPPYPSQPTAYTAKQYTAHWPTALHLLALFWPTSHGCITIMKLLPRITLLCASLLAVSACSSNRVDPSDYSYFLKDYSRLQPAESPSGAPVMRWIAP